MWCGSSRLVATILSVLIIALVEFVPYSKVPDENIPNYWGDHIDAAVTWVWDGPYYDWRVEAPRMQKLQLYLEAHEERGSGFWVEPAQ